MPSIDELIRLIYEDLREKLHENFWMFERVLLTPTNDQATVVHECSLLEIEGEQAVYLSINNALDPRTTTKYPAEFLNSVSASGLPAHSLTIKIGVAIVLLRERYQNYVTALA